MIAFENCAHRVRCSWQASFTAMLPELESRIRFAFRNLDPAARDEAVAEAVLHCLLAYCRLYDRGRAHVARPSTLGFYAIRQVRRGRPPAGRINSKEPLSRYGQISRGIRLEDVRWIDDMACTKTASVADQVAARIDMRAWFSTLSCRLRRIARDLAYGFTTSEVAAKHDLTPGRISQLRRELHRSWTSFQGELAPAI